MTEYRPFKIVEHHRDYFWDSEVIALMKHGDKEKAFQRARALCGVANVGIEIIKREVIYE